MRRAIIWLRFVMQLSSNSCRKWPGWRNIWRHNWKPSRVKPPPWSLREWDSAPPKIARWQRKRIQHQDFERRLREMVAERRARPARVTDLVEQQTLHREVEAYEARPGTLPPCAGKNRKQASALNPLAMERVCHWKMPLTMSNWLSI